MSLYVCVKQDKSLKYHVEVYESTPFIELMFQATVPISSLTIPLDKHVGLTVSNCSVTLLAATYTTLRIRAVPTAGRNARIVSLRFGSVVAPGSPWHRFRLHQILVQSVVYSLSAVPIVYIFRVELDDLERFHSLAPRSFFSYKNVFLVINLLYLAVCHVHIEHTAVACCSGSEYVVHEHVYSFACELLFSPTGQFIA